MFSKKTRNLFITVFAFVMAFAVAFGVMGFTTKVSAESTSYSAYSDDGGKDTRVISWNFTKTEAVDLQNYRTNGIDDNGLVFYASASSKIKYKLNDCFSCTSESDFYVYVPMGYKGTITMTTTSSSDSRYFYLVDKDGKETEKRLWSKKGSDLTKTGPQSFTFTSEDLSEISENKAFAGNTYLHLRDNNAEMKVGSITLELEKDVVITGSTQKSKTKLAAYWDAREHEEKIDKYPTDTDGNYVVIDAENGVKVTAQNTVSGGSTKAGGNAIQIVGPKDKNSRAMSWIRIEVPFEAVLKVRCGADGSGSRTFNLNTSADAHDKDVLVTKTHSVGGDTVFSSDGYVLNYTAEAGTYYFWNATDENSAQVYEIVIEEVIMYEGYVYAEGDELLDESALSAQEGYELVGWINTNGIVFAVGSQAEETGFYAPLYAKFTMETSVRLGANGGIRYGFTVEFINDDLVAEGLLNVTLAVEATNKAERENANFEYENGVLISNAVITGWTEETASAWRVQKVKASITLNFGNVKTTYVANAYSAQEVATKFAAENPDYAEELAIYIGQ